MDFENTRRRCSDLASNKSAVRREKGRIRQLKVTKHFLKKRSKQTVEDLK